MSDDQISPKIQKILEDIENKDRTYDQLRNFYQNIHDSDIITEYESSTAMHDSIRVCTNIFTTSFAEKFPFSVSFTSLPLTFSTKH